MNFPAYRPRRLRQNERFRNLIRETALSPANFIYPLFVGPKAQPVSSMPGIAQLTIDRAVDESRDVSSLGIPAVILFGSRRKRSRMRMRAPTWLRLPT